MRIVKLRPPRGIFNWQIYLKDFRKKDYLKFLGLIKKLKLKRDLKFEKKLWEMGGKIKGNWTTRVYNYMQYTYIKEHKHIVFSWNHPSLSGEEFLSIFFSEY